MRGEGGGGGFGKRGVGGDLEAGGKMRGGGGFWGLVMADDVRYYSKRLCTYDL